MKVKELSTSPAFGYESKHIHHKDAKKEDWRGANAMKIVTCIPILGQGLVIAALIAGGKERFKKCSTNKNIRFVITALGVGILLVPVDIAVTAKRKVQQLHMDRKEKAAAIVK